MRLSEQDIKEINGSISDSWNQGVFTQPSWIPNDIKEPVIYMRYVESGYSGGNCWGDEAEYFDGEKEPKFEALDAVLLKIAPKITYLMYRKIDDLIQSSDHIEWEYYGNRNDYAVRFIVLSDLYELLEL